MQSETRNRWLALAVCGFLLLAVGLVFAQTVGFDFVNVDDSECVYHNPHVTGGLSPGEIGWAFSHHHVGAWSPLTWISHMADCQLFGLKPGWHHLTNVVLHAATAVLLFLVLWRMTGRLWPGALAAALFAVHPLRAESVAWVTERKDVLSGLFFVLTLGAYLGYVRHRPSLWRYLAVMVLLSLGLMAKPMLVTLPLVLLLLDYWPLGRIAETWVRLAVEKVPLLALSAGSCVMTVWAQGASLASNNPDPLWWRLGNALVSYVDYLRQFFCPVGLAVAYPPRDAAVPAGELCGTLLLLAAVTTAALLWQRTRPYLLVGWLWYLGMLAPVIGLVPTGIQTAADRFMYLPGIGLCVALAWTAADVCQARPYRRRLGGIASALILAALTCCAWRQTAFWHDSETLWNHALDCNRQNSVARNGLGNLFLDRYQTAAGKGWADPAWLDKAIGQYRMVLKFNPKYAEAHYNLGVAVASAGRLQEAIDQYRAAVQVRPDYANAQNNLGNALALCGQFDEALEHCQRAVKLRPDFAQAHYNLGGIWSFRGRLDTATSEYRTALELAVRQHQPELAGQAREKIALCESEKQRRGE